MIKNMFWLDFNIDSNENQKYLEMMNNEFGNIQTMKEEKKLFEKIKELKFELYIIIIMNGLPFSNYIEYLTNNSIYGIPVSIIFTANEISLEEKLDEKYKGYLKDTFYNHLGIATTIENLIFNLEMFIESYNYKINRKNMGYIVPPIDYKDCYIFEYIDNENKLILPFLYYKIMKNSKVSNDEIKETNKYIFEKYGENDQINNLLIQLEMVENIPLNIIAKYWGRIYTIESPFYRNLNADLMKLKNEDYNSYIQVLYSGLKEFEYKEDITLYRGANISEIETENMFNFYRNRKFVLNKKEFQPLYLIYSRAYLSFSKSKDISLGFIKDINNTKKILFQLKNKPNIKTLSNADVYNISAFPDESEILFFPFSAFLIENIIEEDGIYHIDLVYLGFYENKIKTKLEEVKDNKRFLFEIMNNTNLSKDIFKSKILPKSIETKNNNITNIEHEIINSILLENNKNEICCIYKKEEDEIKLLYDDEFSFIFSNENEVNEENIEIFINEKKIKFCFNYRNEEKGEIEVKFKIKKLLKNISHMFHCCYSLESIDLSAFNASHVTNIEGMFCGCYSLKSIILSSFNTSHVTNMESMFNGCSSLQTIDLSSFNTIKVLNMKSMFHSCSSLKSIDLSSFDTSNVTDMESMFNGCNSLESIDLSSFNTINVISMRNMFQSCSSLESLDLSSFDTINVKNMRNMFSYCSSLKSINLSSFDTTNFTNKKNMFSYCPFLKLSDIKFMKK